MQQDCDDSFLKISQLFVCNREVSLSQLGGLRSKELGHYPIVSWNLSTKSQGLVLLIMSHFQNLLFHSNTDEITNVINCGLREVGIHYTYILGFHLKFYILKPRPEQDIFQYPTLGQSRILENILLWLRRFDGIFSQGKKDCKIRRHNFTSKFQLTIE